MQRLLLWFLYLSFASSTIISLFVHARWFRVFVISFLFIIVYGIFSYCQLFLHFHKSIHKVRSLITLYIYTIVHDYNSYISSTPPVSHHERTQTELDISLLNTNTLKTFNRPPIYIITLTKRWAQTLVVIYSRAKGPCVCVHNNYVCVNYYTTLIYGFGAKLC